jgi:Serine acetyltransferase
MRIIRALVLFIAKILNVLVINILFSSYLPMSTKINIGLEIGHPRGIVINAHSIVGSNCRLEHQVTLGQNNGLFPQLGNNVYVGSGAKIIGGAYIFDNSKVGANAVVNKRFNEPSLLVGVPAVQKKYIISINGKGSCIYI